MVVQELFKNIERKSEADLFRKATRLTFEGQSKIYNKFSNPLILYKKKKIAKEVLWFFASIAIGFLMGYLFFELFVIALPVVKNDIILHFLNSNLNFIYFLSFISFIGVYISRLVVWALNLF